MKQSQLLQNIPRLESFKSLCLPQQLLFNLKKRHSKLLDNTERFVKLTKDVDAIAMLTASANMKVMLSLLLLKVRLDDGNLTGISVTQEERVQQYVAFKQWSNTDNRAV